MSQASEIPNVIELDIRAEKQQTQEWCWAGCICGIAKFAKADEQPTEGELVSLHVLAGRRDEVIFGVSSSSKGGQFNVRTVGVQIDGRSVSKVEEIVSFITSRNYTTVVLNGVDDASGGIGVREVASVELRTAETPI